MGFSHLNRKIGSAVGLGLEIRPLGIYGVVRPWHVLLDGRGALVRFCGCLCVLVMNGLGGPLSRVGGEGTAVFCLEVVRKG
ncbi:MAG: hypothetical protein F6K62_27175 [Sphaerospermopsis sp. SIO1G2]|nr:hypothetical protein [Sphaerospermopsis sp. SIO1G2]